MVTNVIFKATRLRNYGIGRPLLLQPRKWMLPLHRKISSSRRLQSYDDTVSNLRIGSHTRVIFQGFTGKLATANATESLAWGTQIVGGVKPNFEGEHLSLPVFPTVRKAVEALQPDATGIYVAAHQAGAAIEEAIESEIPLIVAVAEHIPLHDILRVRDIFMSESTCLDSGTHKL
jgi:succinyl-CoA synthetase alpha subunit